MKCRRFWHHSFVRSLDGFNRLPGGRCVHCQDGRRTAWSSVRADDVSVPVIAVPILAIGLIWQQIQRGTTREWTALIA